MKYRIEKNTPIPSVHQRYAQRPSLFDTMVDMPPDRTASFLIPLAPKGLAPRKESGIRAEIYATVKKIRAQHPERVYSTRLMPKEKGVRVWRIK